MDAEFLKKMPVSVCEAFGDANACFSRKLSFEIRVLDAAPRRLIEALLLVQLDVVEVMAGIQVEILLKLG